MKSEAARATMAAEGLPRRRSPSLRSRRWSRAGVMEEDERVELIAGSWSRCRRRETTTRSSSRPRRTLVSAAARPCRSRRRDHLSPQRGHLSRAGRRDFPSPRFPGLTADNVLLVVEIADLSLDYDMGRKAALYASFGVRELWFFDAVKLTACVFRDPAPEGSRDARLRSVGRLPRVCRRSCSRFGSTSSTSRDTPAAGMRRGFPSRSTHRKPVLMYVSIWPAGPEDGAALIVSCTAGRSRRFLGWRAAGFSHALGFRVIAPDTRGYGGSDVLQRHEDHALERVVADMIELIDFYRRPKAGRVGHDWGAPCCSARWPSITASVATPLRRSPLPDIP